MCASGFMSPHTYGGSFSAFLDRLCRSVFRKSSSDSSGTRNSISRSQMQYTRCLHKKKTKKKSQEFTSTATDSTSCTQIQQHCIIKNLKILNRMSRRHWICLLFIQHKQLIKQRILSQCITDCNSICFIWTSTEDYSMF